MVLTASANTAKCSNCDLQFSNEALFCPQCGTAKSRDLDGDPLLGSKVGDRFLLTERIGHGASGTIYRAEHVTLRRKVAIKVLHHELSRDDLAIERFRREATTVSEIENEHIVQIHDFGRTDDGRLYLAMELLEGETLDKVLERDGKLSIGQVVDVLMQLGEALAEAHETGFVHRDLRPRNIYLAKRRKRANFVKLLDFGLAKLVQGEGGAASTSLGMTFGEPKYMSPEQARGDTVDRRADIYSLGCIAYEMLTGAPPFTGAKVFDILTRHVDEVPDSPKVKRPQIPDWLNAIVECMLEKDRDERFAGVAELVEALRFGSETGKTFARPKKPVPTPAAKQPSAKVGAVVAPPALTPPAGQLTPAAEQAKANAARVEAERIARDEAARMEAERAAAERAEAEARAAAERERVERAEAEQRAAAEAQHSEAPEHLPPDEPEDDPDDYRSTVEVDPARVKRHLAASGKGGRATTDSAGISAAWYADGDNLASEDDLDDSMAAKLDRARIQSPSQRNYGSTSDMYFDEEKRRWPYFAIGGGVLLIIIAILAWPSGSSKKAAKDDDKVVVTVPDAAPVKQAAPPDAGVPDAAPKKLVKRPRWRPRNTNTNNTNTNTNPVNATPDAGTATTTPKPLPSDKKKQMAVFWAKRGKLALNNSDVVGAATAFKKARELDPNNVDAILGQGELALGQSAYSAAISHLRKAARMRRNNYYVHTLLGEAYLGAGKKESAKASFKRALKLNPDYARAREGYNDAAK